MYKRALAALTVGTIVSTLGFASASVLNVEGGVIQYGEDTLLVCDDNGLTAAWGIDPVTEAATITVSGIAAQACTGATLTVKVAGETWTRVIGPTDTSFAFPYSGNQSSANSVKMWITR